MPSKVIHFFKYLEYDDLYNLGFKFDLPIKSALNTYIAKLKTPIYFILPKNEILDLKQDNVGNNIFQYIIDVDEHSSFLTFLDNLDSLCINLASENSTIWFKKHMDSRKLVDLYNNLYYEQEDDEDSNETLTVCDFHITNTELLDELSDYNDNNDSNLKVYIEGIEFFKKTFKWKMVLDSVVEDIDEDAKDSDNDDADNKVQDDFDFDSLINNADTKSQREDITNKIVNQSAGSSKSLDTVSQLSRQSVSQTVQQKPLDTVSQVSRQPLQQKPLDTVSQISRQPVSQQVQQKPLDTVSQISRQPVSQQQRPLDTVSRQSVAPQSRPSDLVSQAPKQSSTQQSRPSDLVSQAPKQSSRPNDLVSQVSSRLPSMPSPVNVSRQQSDTMSRQSNMPTSRVQPSTSRNIETQSINQERIRNSDIQSRLNNIENVGNNLGRDVIDELADFDTKSNVRKEIIENVQERRELLQDLESKISQKKIEIESYQSNADRARKAAEALSKKALDSQNELKKYQEKFNELSQTTSVLSKSK